MKSTKTVHKKADTPAKIKAAKGKRQPTANTHMRISSMNLELLDCLKSDLEVEYKEELKAAGITVLSANDAMSAVLYRYCKDYPEFQDVIKQNTKLVEIIANKEVA